MLKAGTTTTMTTHGSIANLPPHPVERWGVSCFAKAFHLKPFPSQSLMLIFAPETHRLNTSHKKCDKDVQANFL